VRPRVLLLVGDGYRLVEIDTRECLPQVFAVGLTSG
jgi:hypothetical protein